VSAPGIRRKVKARSQKAPSLPLFAFEIKKLEPSNVAKIKTSSTLTR
jgi:hypothetical protein